MRVSPTPSLLSLSFLASCYGISTSTSSLHLSRYSCQSFVVSYRPLRLQNWTALLEPPEQLPGAVATMSMSSAQKLPNSNGNLDPSFVDGPYDELTVVD